MVMNRGHAEETTGTTRGLENHHLNCNRASFHNIDTADQWQQEIDQKQMTLDKMYKNYEAEQFMLSDDLKKKREDELFVKEKELRDLQKKRFGYEGDLFKERQKMVKPIQDKVYNAVQKLATARGYDFILDKSEGITIIFADPKLDKSDDVLKELGINN